MIDAKELAEKCKNLSEILRGANEIAKEIEAMGLAVGYISQTNEECRFTHTDIHLAGITGDNVIPAIADVMEESFEVNPRESQAFPWEISTMIGENRFYELRIIRPEVVANG